MPGRVKKDVDTTSTDEKETKQKKSGQVGRPRKNAQAQKNIANTPHASLEQVTSIRIEKKPPSDDKDKGTEGRNVCGCDEGTTAPPSDEIHDEKIIIHLNTHNNDAKHDELEQFYQLNKPHSDNNANQPPSAYYPPNMMYYNIDDYCQMNQNNKPDNSAAQLEDRASVSLVQPSQKEEEQTECKIVQLLREFDEKKNGGIWPASTNISCFWCCHRFFTVPFGIPIKYTNEKFHVFGCFCSLECALAYNIYSNNHVDEIWERSNLIHFLGRKVNYGNRVIKPAPHRCSLKMFGGYLSIDEFRKYSHQDKHNHVNFPPMISVNQQIEEINECDINNNNDYIPLDTDRINKYKERMRLKRTKPIHDSRSTLDHAINIKITSGSS